MTIQRAYEFDLVQADAEERVRSANAAFRNGTHRRDKKRNYVKPVSVETSDGFNLTEPPADRPLSQRKAQKAIHDYLATEKHGIEPKHIAIRRFFPRIPADIMPLVELIVLMAAGFLGAYVIMLILKGVLS